MHNNARVSEWGRETPPFRIQRLSKHGRIEKALKDDPLQEVIMNSRPNNQNGHPFAVPSERARHEKSVGGPGRGGR